MKYVIVYIKFKALIIIIREKLGLKYYRREAYINIYIYYSLLNVQFRSLLGLRGLLLIYI